MSVQSTKPYLIRSIFEWCVDSGFTPFISVKAYDHLDLPREHVKNGEIVFNIGANAVQQLVITNDQVSFMARFNSIARKIEIPMSAVQGIFAKEVNQGMAFSADDAVTQQSEELIDPKISISQEDSMMKITKKAKKPALHIVK